MERRVLGRGLSALIPEASREALEKGEFVQINVNQIKLNPYQPRKEFSQTALNDLASSIKKRGVIQPIVVRQTGVGQYELVAGERRLRAAKMSSMETVPAIIKELKDQDSLELSLIENIQRESLNPIEEAKAYQMLMDKFELTQEKMAEAVGKARATISNILRLLKLPQEIQNELQKGTLSFAHARTLLEVEDADLQQDIFRDTISNSLSVKELENLIRQKVSTKVRQKTPAISSDPYKKDLESRLSQSLGTKVSILNRKKRGKIEIEYYSPAELERIVNKIIR